MSKELSDLERRAENYRAALEKIAETLQNHLWTKDLVETVFEIASDALAEDAQERVEPDADLANALHFSEL